jgi:polyisoprenoid-binding protein YceI
MNRFLSIIISIMFLNTLASAQDFKIKAKGKQIFNFEDKLGRNQIVFFSSTPLEDFTGTANSLRGKISFEIGDFAKTLKGMITVKVNSINTGIELRNHRLQSAKWLDESKFHEIVFEIISVHDLRQIADNKLEFKVAGNFFLHGITKKIEADAEAIYLDENNQTRSRAPGDLLGVHAKFNVKLSDFNIENDIIGEKVAETIGVKVNIVGTNKF